MTDTSPPPERMLATKRTLDGRRAWYSEEIAVPLNHKIVAPYIREDISLAHEAAAYEAAAQVAEKWTARDMHEAMTPGAFEQTAVAREIAAAIRNRGKGDA